LPLVLYTVTLLVAGLAVAPLAGLIALLRPAWRRGLAARLGIGWPILRGEVLWAHAASVGEVEGIAPLVRTWQRAHPTGSVVFSALTATGCAAARRVAPDAYVRTFPFDLPWIVRGVVRRIRPSLFLFSENELWPNALAALADARVPVAQVSGRLSQRGAGRLRQLRKLGREMLARVDLFCVQAAEHRDRLLALGVPADRVVVTGSLKGDRELPPAPPFASALAALGRSVIVAGSTHPGEETALLDARAALAAASSPFLVLAPRHPERFSQVAALLARRGIAAVRRSGLAEPIDPERLALQLRRADVLLLDTLGELAGAYGAADVAFIGGTLLPVGGHNVLEAARAGTPVVVGPHHWNVEGIVSRLVAAGAGAVAAGPSELAPALARFLDPGAAWPTRAAASEVAARESGGLEATWAALSRLASVPAAPPPVERRSAPAPASRVRLA
jgi:3-deoxy-D-manno-octulosonic-acid transferase